MSPFETFPPSCQASKSFHPKGGSSEVPQRLSVQVSLTHFKVNVVQDGNRIFLQMLYN
jgi:hypothetical protein